MEETTSETLVPSPTLEDQLAVPTGAADAAKLVMLAIIFLVLGALLAFIFRLRYLAKNPLRDAAELEQLSEEETETF